MDEAEILALYATYLRAFTEAVSNANPPTLYGANDVEKGVAVAIGWLDGRSEKRSMKSKSELAAAVKLLIA